MKPIPSLMFIGGFLGAGKTTAIRELGEILTQRGLNVAAITNDQADGLVDTVFLQGNGIATQEVAGSCFCCNFPGLSQALNKSMDVAQPDIILAEPVGSCTDIVATVIRPMRDQMGNNFKTLAYSVLVEPQRWSELIDKGGDKVSSMKFLFDKQLEEADFIVITKTDTLNEGQLNKLANTVAHAYPHATVLAISAKEGIGLEEWLDNVQATPPSERWLKKIDYDEYAEAEADMGWLNAQVSVQLSEPIDGNAFAIQVANDLKKGVSEQNGRIGNLKILAVREKRSVKCGTSFVDGKIQMDNGFLDPLAAFDVTVNIRATVSPDSLISIVRSTVDDIKEQPGVKAEISYLNTFRPAPPNPTYRYNQDV